MLFSKRWCILSKYLPVRCILPKQEQEKCTPAGVMELVDVVDSNPLVRTRALPVAEEARVEQVQRSVRDEGVYAEDIRRVTANDGDIPPPLAATL